MFTQPHQARFGLVRAQLGRALFAASRAPAGQDRRRSPHDPVFLPDFVPLTPDQVLEMRYGKGRGR